MFDALCHLQKDTYDTTGKIQLSVEEQLRQSFGRGNTCCCQRCQHSGKITCTLYKIALQLSTTLFTHFMSSSTSHLVEWTTGNFRDAGSGVRMYLAEISIYSLHAPTQPYQTDMFRSKQSSDGFWYRLQAVKRSPMLVRIT